VTLWNVIDDDAFSFERSRQRELGGLVRKIEDDDKRSGGSGPFVGVEIWMITGDVVIGAEDERWVRLPDANHILVKREY
jgi:hypothetical protein